MASKNQLRQQRSGTVINATSQKQETDLVQALRRVEVGLRQTFPQVQLWHEQRRYLHDIVRELRQHFEDVDFHCHSQNTWLMPDGGFLYIRQKLPEEAMYPILVSEVKHQGTNDARAREGQAKQAKGNAIERLGKNLIGLRAALMYESIFPFVCFGYGCDFAPSSTILDRVTTMAMFGKLSRTYLVAQGAEGRFNRGSFYFREEPWTITEMTKIMQDIATRSVYYYFAKYGQDGFSWR